MREALRVIGCGLVGVATWVVVFLVAVLLALLLQRLVETITVPRWLARLGGWIGTVCMALLFGGCALIMILWAGYTVVGFIAGGIRP